MKNIVVLDRSWVVIGDVSKNEDCDHYTLENGFVIRRWGTTQGIGQLALTGKTEDTILDALPTTHFHEDKIIMVLDCLPEAGW